MVSATSINTTDAAVISRATALLRLVRLSAQDQLTIEHAIGLIAIDRNCSRDRAAQVLHRQAFSH
jgi:hypothetical protein